MDKKRQVEAFLTRRGFTDVHDMPIENLRPLYFTGVNAKRSIRSSLAIVSAGVK